MAAEAWTGLNRQRVLSITCYHRFRMDHRNDPKSPEFEEIEQREQLLLEFDIHNTTPQTKDCILPAERKSQ
jgi:hypothetical protein